MPAYVVVSIEVHDPERYAEYIERAPATVANHGGRYLVRNGEREALEGEWDLKRFVILEFPTYEAAKAWYESEDYAPVMAIRHATATSRMVVTEGV
jgi:uncharacterized protein (DUF1330 family)